MRNKNYKKLRNRIEEMKYEIISEIRYEFEKRDKKKRKIRFNFRGMETKFFISFLTCLIFILSSIILFDSMIQRIIFFVIAELITDILIWKSNF